MKYFTKFASTLVVAALTLSAVVTPVFASDHENNGKDNEKSNNGLHLGASVKAFVGGDTSKLDNDNDGDVDIKLPPGLEKKVEKSDNATSTHATSTKKVHKTVAPHIFGPIVLSTGSSSANIFWFTSGLSSSNIFLSTTAGVTATGTPAVQMAGLEFFHNLQVTGLTASTTYYYVVASTNNKGSTAVSGEHSFTTTASISTPDTTAPVISNVTATTTTASSTEVTWITNEPSSSVLWYSTTTPVVTASPSLTISSGALVVNHGVDLSNLNASTTYYYTVSSADASNNTATTSGNSVTTLGL